MSRVGAGRLTRYGAQLVFDLAVVLMHINVPIMRSEDNYL
jgi:hypothetical protein